MNVEYKEVQFPDRSGLESLSKFHHDGGILSDTLQVICERNFRTPLINGVLKSWQIGSVKMDLTGYGKYAESSCIVDIDGKETKWPFSMLYVKK